MKPTPAVEQWEREGEILVSVRGVVEHLVHADQESGFGVVRLWINGGIVSAVGPLAELSPGEEVTLSGSWMEHRTWGRQLKACDVVRHLPVSTEGITRFLGSGLVKGVGMELAQRIVSKFGEMTLEVVEHEPRQLAGIPGLGPLRRRALVEAVARYRGLKDLLVFLGGAGIGSATGLRLWKALGPNALGLLRSDPYRLIGAVRGVGFRTADALALRLGLDAGAASRHRAAIAEALQDAARSGHVFLPESSLLHRAGELIDGPADSLSDALEGLTGEGVLVLDSDERERRVYETASYEMERDAARRLAALAHARPRLSTAPRGFLGPLAGVAALDDSQWAALDCLARSNVVVITGPPGTGKTLLVRALHAWLRREKCVTALCAPTGRAAHRLGELVGAPAATVHRLLGMSPDDAQDDLDGLLKADAVVLDEASMVDLPLFRSLIGRLTPGQILILVGDEDQLPSVGPGAVLADVIRSGIVPVARLSRIFRQGPGSGIVHAADRIRRGLDPLAGGASPEVTFVPEDRPAEAARAVAEEAAAFPGTQVLSPMNRGQAGVHALNDLLRARLNPGARPIRFGGSRLHEGDRVIHLANDYRRNLFNGEVGRLVSVETSQRAVTAEFGRRRERFTEAEIGVLAPAFALSVHKAQGSEYPVVILPVLLEQGFMLRRNLLYTAVTRAREKVVLVGSRRALAMAVRSDRVDTRHTRLAARCRACGGREDGS